MTKRKRKVLNRYGRACSYCRVPLSFKSATIDHVVPRSRGGSNDIGNLRPACGVCNALKADLSPCEFQETASILRNLRRLEAES
jgi:5-methylcytosine-specific restriction endonuclease McrA